MKLPIYNDKLQFVGLEEREQIHRQGLWHRNVQVNILNKGCLLMQQRSDHVDIAKYKLDQSMATHLLVGETGEDAVKRGLYEELGIKNLEFYKVAGPFKIIKKYKYDKSLYNREFVSLYCARYNKIPKTNCAKVQKLFWMNIDKVIKDVNANPDNYTKTFVMWVKKGYLC